MTDENPNIKPQKIRGDEPTQPGPIVKHWKKEKEEMKQVIHQLLKIKHMLESQNTALKETVKKLLVG